MLKRLIESLLQSARYVGILKTASAGGIAQMASIIAQLMIVRLSIEHLGPGNFGIWMSINSVILILMVSDLGISGAMLRLTAHEKDADGFYKVYGLARIAILLLSAIGASLFALALLLTSSQFLISLIGLHNNPNANEILTTIRVLMGFFAINLVAQISVPLRLGMQTGHFNGLFQTCGHICNLIFATLAVHFNGPLSVVAAAAILGTTLANLLNLLTLVKQAKKVESISAKQPSLTKILKPSGAFFTISLIAVLSYNTDNLVILSFLPAEEVSQNAIAQRIFNIPIQIATLFFVGLSASFADAELMGEFDWIRKTYVRTIGVVIPFAVIAGLLLGALFEHLAVLLTKGTVEFDLYLVWSFVAWLPLAATAGATASLMNGLHILKQQVIIGSAALLLNLTLSIFLVNRIGVSGPILATFLSMLAAQPLLVWVCLRELRRRNREGSRPI